MSAIVAALIKKAPDAYIFRFMDRRIGSKIGDETYKFVNVDF